MKIESDIRRIPVKDIIEGRLESIGMYYECDLVESDNIKTSSAHHDEGLSMNQYRKDLINKSREYSPYNDKNYYDGQSVFEDDLDVNSNKKRNYLHQIQT